MEELFYCASGETMEKVFQRGFYICGGVRGQVGWGFGQPSLVEDVPVCDGSSGPHDL